MLFLQVLPSCALDNRGNKRATSDVCNTHIVSKANRILNIEANFREEQNDSG